MTYWLVTTEFPPDSGGGISTYCYHTAEMLGENNHNVFVFIPNNKYKKITSIAKTDNITLVYFPNHNYEHFGEETSLSFRISEVLLSYSKINRDPDVIEQQEYNGIAYYTLQRKWLEPDYFPNTKFVITAHAPSYLYLKYNQAPSYEFPKFWVGEMEKNVLKTADIVISPSRFLVDKLALNKKSAFILHNPFRIKQETNYKIETGDIVFFGKLTPQKGAIEMLHYFEKIWKKGKKISLRIIGSGHHYFYPKKQDLSQYLKKKYEVWIEKKLLIFEGHISPKNIETRLSKAHVILIPSIVDNLPYTVIESMSMGKIVLASTDGGHKELIDHSINGFLFNHRIENDFENQLDSILTLDENQLELIGTRAKESINQKCGYEKVYNEKLNIINSYRINRRSEKKFPFLRPEPRIQGLHQFMFIKNRISVVIPFYNMGLYIDECIDSLLKSNYSDLEILIINDGSTDNFSIEKLESFKKKNSKVKVYDKQNTGLSETRNFGANQASGEYIAFLDPDDTVESEYYTLAFSILKKYSNISYVGCWAKYFGKSTSIWPAFNPEPPYILCQNMINSSAIIIRKNDFINFGKNDKEMIYGMEDYDMIINLIKNGYNGVVIPKCLWNYRIRKNSLAQSFNRFSRIYLYNKISKKHSVLLSKYAFEVINIVNSNGASMDYDNPTKSVKLLNGFDLPFKHSKFAEILKKSSFFRKIAKAILNKL